VLHLGTFVCMGALSGGKVRVGCEVRECWQLLCFLFLICKCAVSCVEAVGCHVLCQTSAWWMLAGHRCFGVWQDALYNAVVVGAWLPDFRLFCTSPSSMVAPGCFNWLIPFIVWLLVCDVAAGNSCHHGACIGVTSSPRVSAQLAQAF
jgi:hypothetical protein